MKAIYQKLCPNCEEDITDERLGQGSLCGACLEKPTVDVKDIEEELERKQRLWKYKKVIQVRKQLAELNDFFKQALGFDLWSAQRVWARRVFMGKSFAIVAPTGVGKTVFGIILSLYLARKGKKCYIMLPTSLLTQQVHEKAIKFNEKLGKAARIVAYHTAMRRKEKDEALEMIKRGEFDILITTDRFIGTRWELLSDKKFDFVFVDDVDAFLRSRRNIDKVFSLLGVSQEILGKALNYLQTKEGDPEEFRKAGEKAGILVFSSATARAKRTKRLRLFRLILGFEVGYRPEFLRNVEDVFLITKNVKEKTLELVKKLGRGGLIFVPSELGKDFAKELESFLEKNGIKAFVYEKPKADILHKFQNGDYEVLVGIASFRSPLARGVDLPETIRYAIFAGVPRQEIELNPDDYNPTKLLVLANGLLEVCDEEERLQLQRIIQRLKKIIPLRQEDIEKIKNNQVEGFLSFARDVIIEAQTTLRNIITPELIEKLRKSKEVGLKEKDGTFRLIIADPVGYIQASGRTSRLFVGGISKGLSVLLVDDEKAFEGLKKRMKWYLEEVEFREYEEQFVDKIMKEIDRDREIIRKAIVGEVPKEVRDFIKVALLIVESPTKAKTIARFFGRPAKREIAGVTAYEITSGELILNVVPSVGHIVDLPEDVGFDGVEIRNGKFVPVYGVICRCLDCGTQFVDKDRCPACDSQRIVCKRNIIKALRELALESNFVMIATDPDTEGEKIAWDIRNLLRPYNPDIKRIEFHEITRKAVKNAIRNPREINENLVNAQIVRRIEDRWIGFELSKKLWEKFGKRWLSAGRVQTPVLGWIIQRCKEASKKRKILVATLENGLKVRFLDVDFKKEYETCKIEITEEKEEEMNPFPPYTTDTLLKDASLKLGFSAEKTMRIAQELFEVGLITYHRTDSTHVSNVGIGIAKEVLETLGKGDLFYARRWGEEGAHECIRPTRPVDTARLRRLIAMGIWRFPIKLRRDHFLLYNLIFNRFIASQCKPAKVIKQKIKASIEDAETELEFVVEIKEAGFLEFTGIRTQNRIEAGVYRIVESEKLRVPAARLYTEGDVIALMKEKEIGRPSTYAKIMETLLKRRYVLEIKNKLVYTSLGRQVWEFLTQNYGKYVSEETTRKLEKEMDEVEAGKVDYQEVLRRIYEEIKRI